MQRKVRQEQALALIFLFDYDKISDTADYMNSNTLADGIEYVIVAGEIVYQDKKLTGAMPGKTIRKIK